MDYYEERKKEAQAKAMTTHQLAKLLLENEDLPIATHAHGHTYGAKENAYSHGKARVGILECHSGPHVVIGNFYKEHLNISKMIRE